GRADRTPQRKQRDRALPRSRRYRGRRARRTETRNLLGQGSLRGARDSNPGLGAGDPRRRHAAAPQLRLPQRLSLHVGRPGPYRANRVAREEMSMQRIRDWMAANPDEAPNVRATNRSFVFFRVTGLSNEGEPVGAQGVPLIPGRSIAVDKIHVYGTPFFIDASLPIESAKPDTPFRRLMIAQDTGSAIVGPARADLYWGAGDDAARIAGRIRHPGRILMLLPRELDMIEAGKHMPLPVAKPNIPEAEVKKDEGKAKQQAARELDTIEAGKQVPLPVAKPKIPETEVKNEKG